MSNKKIVLINNRNYSVKKFRINLIEKLKQNGYQVSLIIIDDSKEQLYIEDVDIYYIKKNNRSINPFNKLHLKREIEHVLKQIKPKKVFTFQVSPNIFGVLAAKKCKIENIYSMVEGAGDVFIYNSLKWKIIRVITCFLYRISFKYCKRIFFLNNDDKDEFIRRKLVKNEKCITIPGIGVDTNYFYYEPIKNTNTFLMIARMMPAKGTLEYCEAARIVKKEYPQTVFNYIGEEFTLTKKDIQCYINDGSINYLGWQDDVREYLKNSFVVCSSSYREGMPMTLMEASCVGRPIIATNNIGNKDVVINNINGLLVYSHNPRELAEKMLFSLKNPNVMIEMGKNTRKIAEQKYDKEIINNIIIKEI